MRSSYDVRLTRPEDRQPWLNLWSRFLDEHYRLGGSWLPSAGNATAFRVLFDAYHVGGLHGLGVLGLADDTNPVGCLLAGESPLGGWLETRYPKTAILWGVWVDPAHRKQGLAHHMQDLAEQQALTLGFNSVEYNVLVGDVRAEGNAFGWRAPLGRSWQVTVPLGEDT